MTTTTTMTTATETLTTSELWELTHSALCSQQWIQARALLDDLGRRQDVRDYLASAEAYGLTGTYSTLIQERINVVNHRVDAA
jgi:hypothetical protein